MTITVGDTIPNVDFKIMTADGPAPVVSNDLFKGKTVALFGLPGAFTPTCSASHVPGFVANAAALKAKGVDTIACVTVNDAFVTGAWAKDQNTGDDVLILADGSAKFAIAAGLDLDLTERGMGIRCTRFSMVVKDGVVEVMNLEAPGAYEVSSADHMLTQL